MTPTTAAPPTFATLPSPARAYIVAVVAAGGCCLAFALTHLRLEHVGLSLLLLVLAIAVSDLLNIASRARE